jgi:16S rRNA (adenine1518-N6/adenine1519-N6)-dimethyltransferase
MRISNEAELKKLLDRHGFKFSKAMGQNFLIDPAVPEHIADGAGVDASFGVLEIGPGIGVLTARLAELAGAVTAVELDKRLLPILKETLRDYDNVRVVQGDILALDVGALLHEAMPGKRYAVCANLPYNITTPVLTMLYETALFESITVMVQREVALRMCAKAGTADYGSFTVLTAFYAQPELLFDVPPESFTPRPKVTSSVVRLRMRGAPPPEIAEPALFFRVVRASFAQRRKTLVNGLESAFKALSKEELKKIVTDCGFDAMIRGEALDLKGFAAVTRAISERLQ